MDFRERVLELKKRKNILIAAHRGTSGGCIVNNTIAAFENALLHKADILEIDAAMSADGVFYAVHDGTEPLVLGNTVNIRKMDSAYIDTLYLRTPNLALTREHPNRLEHVFEHLRGRCLINIDRAYFYWKEILDLIKRMNMEDYIVIKSSPKPEDLALLESLAPGLAYMPILTKPADAECLKNYRINYCMAELVWTSLDSPLLACPFLEGLRKQGILLWGNALALDEWFNISAWKDDYRAIMGDPDGNWGWFADKGFDVIQTDWPMLLREYLDKKRGQH
ncbi:MAG: glycerophosphodiester phosphodiesterase family protein [Treponemataceae bacterium]|nr:MAG: glycerophosphodiester phosphodiesterase family protein [Treponemataceae bacterium]